jgi:response regulator RpfG family c-di-GMP phosphodiesterase
MSPRDLLEALDARRVLIVDDDDDIRSALRRILEADHYEVTEAATASEALASLDRGLEAALVVSDLHMPDRDGHWLLQEIRRGHRDVGVMMLSGDSDLDTAVGCLKVGALDYLSKPMSVAEVHSRVGKAFEEIRRAYELRQLREHYQEQLEQQVDELSARNRGMFLAQIQMAVTMLEAKDPYTRGHSGRVAAYAVRTGQLMGLDMHDLEELRLGGELHDIGKIGTRDAVLNKPGPLTTEEFTEMRRHTIDGEAMLGVLREDHPLVLQIVRWHHERIDGTGFPDGLTQDDIPMPVRIVAVADAFDAMTSTRAYRDGRRGDWAVDELVKHSGSHFDAQVVRAFLAAHPDAGRAGAPPTPSDEAT